MDLPLSFNAFIEDIDYMSSLWRDDYSKCIKQFYHVVNDFLSGASEEHKIKAAEYAQYKKLDLIAKMINHGFFVLSEPISWKKFVNIARFKHKYRFSKCYEVDIMDQALNRLDLSGIGDYLYTNNIHIYTKYGPDCAYVSSPIVALASEFTSYKKGEYAASPYLVYLISRLLEKGASPICKTYIYKKRNRKECDQQWTKWLQSVVSNTSKTFTKDISRKIEHITGMNSTVASLVAMGYTGDGKVLIG